MKLIFERSRPGRGNGLLPSLDVPAAPLPEKYRRKTAPRLPELGESDLSRHYQALARRAFGVCDGFYPLGSCTMKYNPKLGEEAAALPGFTGLHPLQPAHTVQGAQAVLNRTEHLLCEITGMDAVTLQPAAGATAPTRPPPPWRASPSKTSPPPPRGWWIWRPCGPPAAPTRRG